MNESRPPGLRCPACGAVRTLKAVYVRHKPGQTMRVRRCLECQRRVVTVEKVVPDPPSGTPV